MPLLDVLMRWNPWGTAKLEPGLKREATPEVINAIGIDQIVVLTGPRRTGKSTILYQVIDYLIKDGVDPKSILHVNFEDPGLALDLSLELLDQIYDEYRAHIYPKGKAYLFFDEIQRVLDWERWIRARSETEDVKIFITGSSAQLMSRELATLLTGRHLSFTILPLNFREYLYFRDIEEPTNFYSYKATPTISNVLIDYLTYGGYPGIALIDRVTGPKDTSTLKKQLLLQYFDDLLFKDVALRHQIRDLTLLRNLAIHLLTNSAGFMNYTKLGNKLSASPDVIQDYCMYLREAYLIDLMQLFSLKVTERTKNDQKVHAVDIGLRNVLSISNSEDFGKNVETVVHNNLKTDSLDNIYYYKDKKCDIDLLVHRNNQVTKLVQVMYKGLDVATTMEREITALQTALQRFPNAEAELIVDSFPNNWQEKDIPKNIKIIPLWKFLLSSI